MSRKNKIALGTAQFGMNYGISNKRGKIPKKEVFEILDEASESGVDTLDTAYSYGESEVVIGEFIKESKKDFKLLSKLPECEINKVKSIFESSIERLGVDALHGYLVHSFHYYKEHPEVWSILERLKFEGKIGKIGFSLYFPYELEWILRNKINADIIQLPYSIFDQRFQRYLPELKDSGVEVLARSVFLQGLVFKNPNELDVHFLKIREKISNLKILSMELDIPIAAICLNFAYLNKFVDKVVVGVDSIENFRDIINSSKYLSGVESILNTLDSFKEEDERIIVPSNWNLETKRVRKGGPPI